MTITEVRRALKLIGQVNGETKFYYEDAEMWHQNNVALRAIAAELDLMRKENEMHAKQLNETLQSVASALWSVGGIIETK